MNRTIKFQLSNIKKVYIHAAALNYGIIALMWLIGFLFSEPEFTSGLIGQPTWFSVLEIIFIPFTFISILYALYDGLMSFDSAIRFGISRKNYFVTQLVIYLLLTILLVIGDGFIEFTWTETSTFPVFFDYMSDMYFTFRNIATEYIQVLGLAAIMHGIYRFKTKALVTVFLAGPALAIVTLTTFRGSNHSVVTQLVMKMADIVISNPELTYAAVIAILMGIYYLFVTRTEAQS